MCASIIHSFIQQIYQKATGCQTLRWVLCMLLITSLEEIKYSQAQLWKMEKHNFSFFAQTCFVLTHK